MIRMTFIAALLLPAFFTKAKEVEPGSIFQNVATVLTERYYDQSFRENELPSLIKTYARRAANAQSFADECAVVQEFLANIPASHLALLSNESFNDMHNHLFGTATPSFGFELIEYDGKHYAFNILEGGPADRAGLKRGDRVVTVDGILTDDSPRLGWRTDDAFLPDPPLRPVLGSTGDVIKLRVERRPGRYQELEIATAPYSAWDGAKSSVRIIETDDARIGYVHFWLIHMNGPDELLKSLLEGDFADCNALILDLRGRGGSGSMVSRMLRVLDGSASSWNKPTVCLINRHSRSAKEVLAYECRRRALGSLVGERTAGAVIPASIADVGYGMKLMYPRFTLPDHTEHLEFIGVSPDVMIAEAGPYSAGRDPILEAGVTEAARLAKVPLKSFTSKRAAAVKKLAASSNGDALALTPPRPHTRPKTKPVAPDPPGFDPKAMRVLDSMVAAMGGEEVLQSHRYRTIRGKRVIGGMVTGDFAEYHAAPNMHLSRMTLEHMGTVEQGFNGSTGWSRSPFEGAKLLTGDELSVLRAQSDIHFELNLEEHHKSIVYVQPVEFADRPCHEIRMTGKSGRQDTYFIDSETHLPKGWVGEVKSNMGPVELKRVFMEYKVHDGEAIAVRYVDDVGGMQEMKSTVAEVSFAEIPDSTFAVPAELATGSHR